MDKRNDFRDALSEFLKKEVGPENFWITTDLLEGGVCGTFQVWGEQFEENDDE